MNAGAEVEDIRQFEEFQKQINFWINWRDADGKRAFVVPSANCSNDAEAIALDKISFGEWLRQKGFNSERLIWYCDYATRDDYGLKLENTSAWAGLFYFCSRVREVDEESQSFITFPEGNGRYVNYFHSQVKENSRLKTLVVEIIPNENTVDIVYLKHGNKRSPRNPRRKSDLRCADFHGKLFDS